MTFAEDVAGATKTAVCGFLANGGNAAIGAAVVHGLRVPGGQVPSLVAGLGLLALNYGCNFDPNTTGPADPNQFTGCKKVSSGTMTIVRTVNGVQSDWYTNVVEVVSLYRLPDTSGGYELWHYHLVLSDGVEIGPADGSLDGWTAATTRLNPGAVCEEFATGQPAPNPQPDPVPYTTPEGCNLTINFDSWFVDEDQSVRPVLKIEVAEPAPGARADGGVIGGCNWPPITVVGGGRDGDPPFVTPYQPIPTPDGGRPWWFDLLVAAGKAATFWAVQKALDELFGEQLPEVKYQLVAPCELDSNGEPIVKFVEVTVPAQKMGGALAGRLDALMDIAQAQKDFRQPICHGKRKAGRSVMVHFKEVSDPPEGHRPMTKRLAYRDQTGKTDAEQADHWAGFAWEAGPVVVSYEGTAAGTVQVWGSSEAEARRVIAHACAAAGVSPSDPAGRYVVGVSKSTRNGRSGTMMPCKWDMTSKLMVSRRDGPSGLPSWKLDL